MTTRREVVLAFGWAVVAAPQFSFAQVKPKVWRIGVLSVVSRSAAMSPLRYGAFLDGLRDLGYVDGRNIAIEWRTADGESARLPQLAKELVDQKVDVIVTNGTPAVRALQAATATIPIVVAAVGDWGSGRARLRGKSASPG